MAPVIPTVEPIQARAGETWLWDAAFSDYPRSDGWALSYELRGVDRITIAAALTTANGEGWHVVVPATTTAGYAADSYEFIAVLTGSGTYAGRVHHLALPRFQILPNLVTAAAGDRVSHAQEMLNLVRIAIKARIAGDEPEFYAVDGSSAKTMSMDQLRRLEIGYAAIVARQTRPSEFGQRVQFRNTPVSR